MSQVATVTEPRLELRTETTLPLDECLVALVAVQAGTRAVEVSARLNLIEGDLTVKVTGPGGFAARCAWPWPVDTQRRTEQLAPGGRLVGSVPLIATDTSAPLFPAPGDYTLVATFDAAPGVRLTSPPVKVRRTPGRDSTRAAALRDREVIQSLLSASSLGNASTGLRAVAAGANAATQALAALANDTPEAVPAPAGGDTGTKAEATAAVAAVLPEGLADDDTRRANLLSRLGSTGALAW
jgi:hypothetical protein